MFHRLQRQPTPNTPLEATRERQAAGRVGIASTGTTAWVIGIWGAAFQTVSDCQRDDES